jgi:hypothetical protein
LHSSVDIRNGTRIFMRHMSPRVVTVVLVFSLAAFAAQAQSQQASPRVIPVEAGKATIEGTALDSSGRAIPDALVRLRDARTGQILATEHADKEGLFSFGPVDPGLYIVEIVGSDRTVLAASPLLTADSDQVVSTVVRLPVRTGMFGFLGKTVPTAAIILSAAGAAGILATSATGDPVCEMPTR